MPRRSSRSATTASSRASSCAATSKGSGSTRLAATSRAGRTRKASLIERGYEPADAELSAVIPTLERAGRSSAWSERRLWEAEAVGSNPTVPIYRARCQSPPRSSGMASPAAVTPSFELVRADHEVGVDRRVVHAAVEPLLGARLEAPGSPARSRSRARCATTRSRRRACRRRRGRSPRRASESTSATSPSRDAPGSVAMSVRITSSPESARSSTARLSLNVTSSPRTMSPWIWSGSVDAHRARRCGARRAS